ncbi:conserved hypothetical protein, partial [Ixodes scapularis]
ENQSIMDKLEASLKTSPTKQRSPLLGKIALAASGIGAFGIIAVTLPFLSPAFRRICLPYVPATDAQLRNVMSALGKRTKRSGLVDLGSGDGRIVFEAAKLGFVPAVGVELNPWLVAYSKIRALATKSPKTSFLRMDLWKFELSGFDNVVVFGVQEMMPALEQKLADELSSDAWVVACRFPLPSLKPDFTQGTGIDTVWVYRMSTRVK